MINRVRSSIHCLEQLGHKEQDEKSARAVLMLSAILLLPYLCRLPSSPFLSMLWALYSVCVIPAVISANCRFPVSTFKVIHQSVKNFAEEFSELGGLILKRMYSRLDRMEREYMKMGNICAMINQLIFFMVCDRSLSPGQKVTCLYTLMFYNVIAYCAAYLKEQITKEDWSLIVTVTPTSKAKHLAMTATKVVLEWTKAVTFIITVVFMLLVFGLEQGLDNYNPTKIYLVITGAYYVLTEKVFIESFPSMLQYFNFEALESLESLWAPVILKATTVFLSAVFVVPVIFLLDLRVAGLALYLNVYLKLKDVKLNSWKPLARELVTLSRYRKATKEEISETDDVCAVCLATMKWARVTPCHHLFHADCLRQCLKSYDKCPICKQLLL